MLGPLPRSRFTCFGETLGSGWIASVDPEPSRTREDGRATRGKPCKDHEDQPRKGGVFRIVNDKWREVRKTGRHAETVSPG